MRRMTASSKAGAWPRRNSQCHSLAEILRQQHDIAMPLAQRREFQHVEGQAVEQVGIELTNVNKPWHVGVGRADDAGIDLHACGAAHALECAVLHHAQDFLLHRHWDEADLVEKKRVLVGRLEPASTPYSTKRRIRRR